MKVSFSPPICSPGAREQSCAPHGGFLAGWDGAAAFSPHLSRVPLESRALCWDISIEGSTPVVSCSSFWILRVRQGLAPQDPLLLLPWAHSVTSCPSGCNGVAHPVLWVMVLLMGSTSPPSKQASRCWGLSPTCPPCSAAGRLQPHSLLLRCCSSQRLAPHLSCLFLILFFFLIIIIIIIKKEAVEFFSP